MDSTRPPARLPVPKGTWVARLVLRILAAISSIVIIGITAALTSDYFDEEYYYALSAPIVVLAPPAAIGFVWDVADGICLIARQGHHGIHPGAVVTLDLILWLGFVTSTILFGLMHYVSDPYYSDYSSYFDSADYDDLTRVNILGSVTLAFCSLAVILHFTLFIFGCVETSRRNNVPPVIYYTGMQQPIYYGQPYPYPQQPGYGQQPAYGQQPIILPAGQPPPPGWVPVAYGPQTAAPHPANPDRASYVSSPSATSPAPPREPSPVHSANGHNSYQAPSTHNR